MSSQSRFVRGAFIRLNSVTEKGENESISQFFHILGSVEQQKGCVKLVNGAYEYTIYSSCCNTVQGIYYYRTYGNSQVTAVSMKNENLEGEKIVKYPVLWDQHICYQN